MVQQGTTEWDWVVWVRSTTCTLTSAAASAPASSELGRTLRARGVAGRRVRGVERVCGVCVGGGAWVARGVGWDA